MKLYPFLFLLLLTANCGNRDNSNGGRTVKPSEIQCILNPDVLNFSASASSQTMTITTNMKWTVACNQSWCTVTPTSGNVGSEYITVSVISNISVERSAEITFTVDNELKTISVNQEAGSIPNYVPDGYTLVWQDEFNDERLSGGKPALPNTSEWWYENGASGWGNNEIQNYISGFSGKDTCAKIHDGTLKIIAKKVGNQVLSVRMNTNKSWCYGYFEARIKMPAGKGTWPAFWMLPKNFVNWPHDGEIDIVEFVGFNPNQVHSSIHCKAYNHLNNTEKTASKHIPTAQTDFHVYAVEWTEYYIHGYVDGVRYFVFNNDKTGNKDTWPFNAPFYLKLNLAWGGNWGGAHGVDETALPATYEIDYVRVYQIIP